MLAIYYASCVFLLLSAFGVIISLIICASDGFDSVVENIFSCLFAVILVLSIIGVSKTYDSEEVINEDYVSKVNAIKDAENELEKFLIKNPQFKEKENGRRTD